MICEVCGKHNVYTKLFKNGNTSDNRKQNLMFACPECAHTFMMNRLKQAAKVLGRMGFKYDSKGWRYNNKVIRSDMVDIGALEHQIKFLRNENKELKRLLGMKR